MSSPLKTDLAALRARLARLEAERSPVPRLLVAAIVQDVPAYPGHDGRRRGTPGVERDTLVQYPGRAARPLLAGELAWLRARYGERLVEPFLPRIGEATRHAPGERDEDEAETD